MEDRYRLVFRGEVLDGQHPAVVKKRLGVLLKVDGARLDGLFAGASVVIQRDIDTEAAARFQAAFKKAGARLRVLPVADDPVIAGGTKRAPPPKLKKPPRLRGSSSRDSALGLTLRPTGELLDAAERKPMPTVIIDVSHLSLAPVGRWISQQRASTVVIPDTEHFTIADLGADLSPAAALVTTLEVTVDPDWELGVLGENLVPTRGSVQPAEHLVSVNFGLAPRGADLGQKRTEPAPPAPDTSHLQLV